MTKKVKEHGDFGAPASDLTAGGWAHQHAVMQNPSQCHFVTPYPQLYPDCSFC